VRTRGNRVAGQNHVALGRQSELIVVIFALMKYF
jgi:hypothetical protein